MHEKDAGIRDSPVSICGHRNPPSAHFCDACGVKLPTQCLHCSAINRGQANFCSNCGVELRDAPRMHAAPSIVPFHSSIESLPAMESQTLVDSPEPFQSAKQTVSGGTEGLDSEGGSAWVSESGNELLADEDAQRLRLIARFAQQRRRRSRLWLATIGASIVIGLLGAALVGTHTAPLIAGPPPFVRTSAQGGAIKTSAITQPTPTSTDGFGATVQPDRDGGSGVPAAAHKLPLISPPPGRAGDELTFVAPSEPRSGDARRDEVLALRNKASSHSNTLLHNATMLSAADRHAGSVLGVGANSLLVHEVGRAGEEQKLHVTITHRTRIIESRRNPAASDAQDSFTDKTISLAEVKKGDYVVVDASREGTNLVAASVTVTLRGNTP